MEHPIAICHTETPDATPRCSFTWSAVTTDTCPFTGLRHFPVLSPLEAELEKLTPEQYQEMEAAISALLLQAIAGLHLLTESASSESGPAS